MTFDLDRSSPCPGSPGWRSRRTGPASSRRCRRWRPTAPSSSPPLAARPRRRGAAPAADPLGQRRDRRRLPARRVDPLHLGPARPRRQEGRRARRPGGAVAPARRRRRGPPAGRPAGRRRRPGRGPGQRDGGPRRRRLPRHAPPWRRTPTSTRPARRPASPPSCSSRIPSGTGTTTSAPGTAASTASRRRPPTTRRAELELGARRHRPAPRRRVAFDVTPDGVHRPHRLAPPPRRHGPDHQPRRRRHRHRRAAHARDAGDVAY